MHYHAFYSAAVNVLGGAGGLEARVKIQDQRQWDGQGSPSEAVEKSAPPTTNTALTLTDYKLIDCVCVCVCVYMFTGCLEE